MSVFKKCITLLTAFLIFVSIVSCSKEGAVPENSFEQAIGEEINGESENAKHYSLEAVDEGEIIFYSSEDYYRYGPSIMKNTDGSYDAWFSSPGNSGSQWDWIAYRHSDDGINWSNESIVLRPTPGSKDQCSVCDPGLIYFDGYYLFDLALI